MSTDLNIQLSTQNLAIGYKTKKSEVVLARNIQLQINKGSLVAIVGPNGSGKSTLIKTLTRSLNPIMGNVYLNNTNIESFNQLDWAKQLSVVLTKSPASKNLTVYELVALGRHPYTNWIGTLTPEDTEQINQAMAVTQTTELSTQKCYTLSDGQLQRVYIARAIAQNTPLVVLDEPTTHLDLNHKAQVLQVLNTLAKSDKAILFSTHDIDLALDLCDQLIVLKDQQVFSGSPKQVIANGILETLFPVSRVKFDAKNGRFTLNK